MANLINLKELENTLYEQYKVKTDEQFKKVTEIKEQLIACTDKDEFENLLYTYESHKAKLDRLNNADVSKTLNAAKLFNTMAGQLTHEFNAEVDAEKHTIRFKWFGRTLSYPVILLSKKYDFHAGMFGFESSFTTHEAYTADNFLFHIGIARDDSDTILIDFGSFGI